jgi:hypothetical protein
MYRITNSQSDHYLYERLLKLLCLTYPYQQLAKQHGWNDLFSNKSLHLDTTF